MNSSRNVSPVVIFTHSGRTGGDDFGRMLQQVYHRRRCIVDHTVSGVINALRSLPLECVNSLKAITGHGAPYGIHHFLAREPAYLSFLRDPVERVISQYYIYKHDPSRGMHSAIHENNVTLEQYAERCPNEQAQYLMGSCLLTHKAPTMSDKEILISRLENEFLALGLTHRYDESIFIISKALGWKERYFWMKTLANKKRPKKQDVPKTVRDKIENNNKIDRILFEYACERFDREISNLSAEDKNELSEYSTSREIYMKLCAEVGEPITRDLHRISLQKKGLKLVVVYEQSTSRDILGNYFNMLNGVFQRELSVDYVQYFSPNNIEGVLSQNMGLLSDCDFIICGDVGGCECLVRNTWMSLSGAEDKLKFAFTNSE